MLTEPEIDNEAGREIRRLDDSALSPPSVRVVDRPADRRTPACRGEQVSRGQCPWLRAFGLGRPGGVGIWRTHFRTGKAFRGVAADLGRKVRGHPGEDGVGDAGPPEVVGPPPRGACGGGARVHVVGRAVEDDCARAAGRKPLPRAPSLRPGSAPGTMVTGRAVAAQFLPGLVEGMRQCVRLSPAVSRRRGRCRCRGAWRRPGAGRCRRARPGWSRWSRSAG